MTIHDLERRIESLERELDELKRNVLRPAAQKDWRKTFGMFANDPEFDEVVRLGKEYRQQQNESR